MAHYRRIGEVPPKRHTQFRDGEGNLHREELMGEEGFSSDSSLLYHRGVPSAIVASEVWEVPDQSRTPNHPLKPLHLRLHDLETDPTERINLAARLPDKVRELQALFAEREKAFAPPAWTPAARTRIDIDGYSPSAGDDVEHIYWTN